MDTDYLFLITLALGSYNHGDCDLGLRRYLRRKLNFILKNDARFRDPLYNYVCEFPAVEIMREFAEANPEPQPGVVTNFLGVRIEPRIMPSLLKPMAGTVEAFPDPINWHADIAEWGSALLSVKEASETYRIVEVGCGWGCWLNNMGFVAKKRGFNVDLIGIEGDRDHLANAERTLRLNGFESEEFRLINGVAADKEGTALFPKTPKSGENWGAEPIFHPTEEALAKARADKSFIELRCYTLDNLSHDRTIDLLHIDIQGSELDFVENNFDSIEKLVRRVLIGTHSRFLEGALQEHFLSKGWALEMDRPVIHTIIGGRPQIQIDGVLLFRNPQLNMLR